MSDHNTQVFFNPLHDPAVRHNTAGDPILTWVQDYPHTTTTDGAWTTRR